MEAVLRAVTSFKEALKDQVTLLRSDNSTVASYINKEGGGGATPKTYTICRYRYYIRYGK